MFLRNVYPINNHIVLSLGLLQELPDLHPLGQLCSVWHGTAGIIVIMIINILTYPILACKLNMTLPRHHLDLLKLT
jgi:hypothetical protein